MRKFFRKTAAIICAAALMSTLIAGCQQTEQESGSTSEMQKTSETGIQASLETGEDSQTDKGTDSPAKTMGRYLEEEASLPEGVLQVFDLTVQTDGSVGLAGADANGEKAVYITSDGGAAWTKKADFPKEIRSEKEAYLTSVALSENGELACVRFDQDTSSFQPLYADKDGKIKELTTPQGDFVMSLDFGDGGSVAGKGSHGVYLYDTSSGNVVKVLEEGSSVMGMAAVGPSLIVFTDKEMKNYSLPAGEQKEKDKVLEEQIKKEISFVRLGSVSGSAPILFCGGPEEGTLNYCDAKGIYSHTLGGNVVEKIVDGELNSLKSPSLLLLSMEKYGDNSFLIACGDETGKSKLLRYAYSKDTPTVPDQEIKVYSLKDNNDVRQAIAQYQKENPDICVTMEVGMDGKDAVTASDAIRTLNTNIMAGKGPDVLVLDGLPVNAYIEKGILEDLTGTLGKLRDSDGFLDNIVTSYEEEGKLYAVPSRFKIPAIQGTKESMESVKDLKSLADCIEVLKKVNTDSRTILLSSNYDTLISQIYDVCSASWQKEDGSLDETALTGFFTDLKRIRDTDKEERKSIDLDGFDQNAKDTLEDISAGTMEFMVNTNTVNIGRISSMQDLAMVVSVNKKTENAEYGLLSGQSEKVFVPNTIIGVSAKSAGKEQAADFAAYVLSAAVQVMNQGGGFPVNKAAFNEMLSTPENTTLSSFSSSDNQTGEMTSLEVVWPEEEDIKTFRSYVESLSTPPITDSTIKDAVTEQAQELLKGSVTVDAAVNSVIQKVNLYLME